MHFSDFYFCVWYTTSLKSDVTIVSETVPRCDISELVASIVVSVNTIHYAEKREVILSYFNASTHMHL